MGVICRPLTEKNEAQQGADLAQKRLATAFAQGFDGLDQAEDSQDTYDWLSHPSARASSHRLTCMRRL